MVLPFLLLEKNKAVDLNIHSTVNFILIAKNLIVWSECSDSDMFIEPKL